MDSPTHPTAQKAWRLKFLDGLRMHGIVTRAAKDAGIHRDTAYFERQQDPTFATEWKEALDRGVDMLEDVAKMRAYDGSDTLLIFLLKAHRPEKYRERYDINHSGEITAKVYAGFDPDDV